MFLGEFLHYTKMIRLYIVICVCFNMVVFSNYINPGDLPQNPQQRKCAISLYESIKCPVCNGQSIADSGADMATHMRLWIKAQLILGRTKQEIITDLEKMYGNDIHLSSHGVIFILLPFMVLLIFIVMLVWRRRRSNE